ncbi:MAG TPA: hypothetical protein DD379_02680 [Cyanobacteria bacterium UBA11162]|nr:hypothetical protein [Cyanobacteria bacterium UBA11162]
MRREALMILGIGAIVTGLAPIAQAQSTLPSNSNGSSVTLSGESLQTVENRTLSDDYQKFFNGTTQILGNDVESDTTSPNQSPPTYSINQELELVVGDTLNSGDPLNLFPRDGEPGDPQRVKLQVPLGE